MVKFTPTALALASVVAIAAAQDSCSSDLEKAPIVGALGQLLGGDDDIKGLLAMLPTDFGKTSLGTCVASLKNDGLLKLASILNDESCGKVIKEKDDLLPVASKILSKPLEGLTDVVQDDKACDKLQPLGECISNSLIEAVSDIVNGEDCCKPFIKSLETAIGASDKEDAEKLLKKFITDVDAVLCSTRPAYDDDSKTTHCVNAMGPAFFSKDSVDINLVKIPNKSGVDAFEAKEFENVDNKTHTFAAAYSSCAWPIDTLVSGLKGLPVMAPLKDAFDDDACIKGSELAKTAADVPLVGTLVSGLSTDDSCYHLANGFSEGADWSVVTTLPSGATSDGKSDGKSDDNKSDDSSTKDNAGFITSVSATAVAMAIAQFFL